MARVVQAVMSWSADSDTPTKLVYVLQHEYTEAYEACLYFSMGTLRPTKLVYVLQQEYTEAYEACLCASA